MKLRVGIMLFFLSLALGGNAQENVEIQVRTANNTLAFPWAGGLNACQFGRIDLDGDGQKDLIAFDRHGNRLLCFLNKGTMGQIDYVFAPEYAKFFPKLTGWAIFADYDGDGREDIFTYSKGWAGMKVFRNVSTEQIGFELVASPYLTSWQGGGAVNIIATNADYPAIVDPTATATWTSSPLACLAPSSRNTATFPWNASGTEIRWCSRRPTTVGDAWPKAKRTTRCIWTPACSASR